ncbi:capsule biosynthesis protein [Basilea psittacipulmonis]|uniref:Capsule biosynthesis protein n=1 Tax=Basilea psittacipulmonis DSM 24701 TaxID=1072685 RepID=A0A077DCG4_9BURK|nr:capsule biosynthesis protein [Basilea psittacipulmonis]AIL32294.1 capsule biosynthesis protein [Basilea psittacipulmonis DSM 24701]
MMHNLEKLLAQTQNVLLLQGPIGPFFKDLATYLSAQGKSVFKINLNAGDAYFYHGEQVFDYVGGLDGFEAFLNMFMEQHHIDSVICFGDHRPYHRIAKTWCQQYQRSFWVFEEGYFRPHYVTLEENGVNDDATTPRDSEFFLSQEFSEMKNPEPLASGFFPMARLAMQYYWHMNKGKEHYPYYQHHRDTNLFDYAKHWMISGVKRMCHYISEYPMTQWIKRGRLGDFYILPLQVRGDSQVKIHSNYDSVNDFLCEVLDSFVHHAPQHLKLIVKHHPMDRGFCSYRTIIQTYQDRYPELKGRLYYVYDIPMPVLLRQGKGMVTINSTSGLSALLHDMPVKVMGHANYDFQGITDQGSLNDFWNNPTPPNSVVFKAYRDYHLHTTQLNGSFYKKVSLAANKSDENK